MTDVKIKDLTQKEINNICDSQPEDGCVSCPLNMFGMCYKRIYKHISTKSVPVMRKSFLVMDIHDKDEEPKV